jgi:3-oxoacyl-[acyl-carrier-protein] synthase III
MHELKQPTVGLRGVAYHFDEIVPIESLPALAGKDELLQTFRDCGHGSVAVSHCSLIEQTARSAYKSLQESGLSANDIDAVVIGTSELRGWTRWPEYFANDVLLALGIQDALVVGVTLAGCANYGSALRMARNLIVAEGRRNVLVIESNQTRGGLERVRAPGGTRASLVFGDAAVSCIVTPEGGDFRVLGMEQIFKPLNMSGTDRTVFVANNVGGFRHVVDRALAQAGVAREKLAQVFIHNMNKRLLYTLLDAVDIPRELMYLDNIRRTGHLWSADNLIGLHDYCAEKNPPSGTVFLLVCQAEAYFSAVVCEKL